MPESDANASQTAERALESLWTAGLSALVEQRLTALATPAAPPEPAPYAAEGLGLSDVTTAEFPPPATLEPIPEPGIRLSGALPPGAPLDRYGLPVDKQPEGAPAEPEKPLEKEIRELKWLAEMLTNRLTRLDERLGHGAIPREAGALFPQGAAAVHPAKKVDKPNDSAALDGYCPVGLVDHRAWQKGDGSFRTNHRGTTYLFATKAAQETFLNDPDRYIPAMDGNDPVLKVDKGLLVAGRREHGAFYNGRVYLFSAEQTLQQFNASPEHYLGGPVLTVGAVPPATVESSSNAAAPRR